MDKLMEKVFPEPEALLHSVVLNEYILKLQLPIK